MTDTHIPLTPAEVATLTDKAVKECSYIELINALTNIDGQPFDREALTKAFRRVAAKPAHERTDFESVVVMAVYRDLQEEITLRGKE